MKQWHNWIKIFFSALVFGTTGGLIQAQEPAALERVTTLSLPPTQSSTVSGFNVRAIDVWVDNQVAAVSSASLVHLVDLANIANPTVHTIELQQGDDSWDAKLKDGFLYVGLQSSADGAALIVYDVQNLSSPVEVARFRSEEFLGTHNLFVAGNVVFLVTVKTTLRNGENQVPAERNSRLWMLDVSDPANPKDLGPVLDTNTEMPITRNHDLTVVGNRAYIAAWVNGIYIVDFEQLDNPQNITYQTMMHHQYKPAASSFNFPNPSTHNLWPSEDGNVLWSTDEIVGDAVRAFDISDLSNPRLLDVYQISERSLPHNVIVQGDYAYVSHYLDGLRVLQLVDEKIVEVTSRDTVGNNNRFNSFRGAFGVFPLENHVLVSDTFNGLLIFEKQGALSL